MDTRNNTHNGRAEEESQRGWKSYNNRSAPSYGFEYKMDKHCGNVKVRHHKRRQKVFSFAGHPTANMFYLMEHYPTLVGMDDSKLCKLVLAKIESVTFFFLDASCAPTTRAPLISL